MVEEELGEIVELAEVEEVEEVEAEEAEEVEEAGSLVVFELRRTPSGDVGLWCSIDWLPRTPCAG